MFKRIQRSRSNACSTTKWLCFFTLMRENSTVRWVLLILGVTLEMILLIFQDLQQR
uniref:Uncharacterized protein n=1 Tax=Picea glauca TaxID=3330 RepID=A0A117NJC7_PICGL|nr:hypothetical protein ABT39_MTgene1125 [Picea glauca]QHR87469.1 hypothetical protein Q903MT_gene1480 [Picea sitchensis]